MNEQAHTTRRIPPLVLAMIPLVLLGVLVAWFIKADPTMALRPDVPPIEELSIQRVILEPNLITLEIVNDGPDPVTVAQVMVDEAYWYHDIEPVGPIGRLGRATIKINYPWVKDEAHAVTLISSTGVTFETEIAVAVESPRPTAELFGLFALLGAYVGVIPVALGLLWLPALRQTPKRWVDFFLFLTIGLLVFLGFDAIEEALETIEKVPNVYQGVGLLVIGGLGSFALLTALGNAMSSRGNAGSEPAVPLAYMIAVGIGLHNLGEGLAIGAAYALGEIALGSMLVLGFMLHNITEGLAIVAPLARSGARIRHLVAMGMAAGLPTIIGMWIGGFTYSPVWALLFLAIGSGAIFQVAWQILRQMARQRESAEALLDFHNTAGLLAGFVLMYATGLLVAV